ncbi:MAG TPA: SitI3 family protein [Amycolatopsis sp.]|uniref:SitI3 family protein n=1 Tax=Amycolatopsis sp. TaxID=37632 RepID=UPI002B4A94FB|nr:SitI3 family protein [Amycolatopsis sp.]HKS44277.1 SitI3 family protein [Amycolatopsis sp.]
MRREHRRCQPRGSADHGGLDCRRGDTAGALRPEDDMIRLISRLLDQIPGDVVLHSSFEHIWLLRRDGELSVSEQEDIWPPELIFTSRLAESPPVRTTDVTAAVGGTDRVSCRSRPVSAALPLLVDGPPDDMIGLTHTSRSIARSGCSRIVKTSATSEAEPVSAFAASAQVTGPPNFQAKTTLVPQQPTPSHGAERPAPVHERETAQYSRAARHLDTLGERKPNHRSALVHREAASVKVQVSDDEMLDKAVILRPRVPRSRDSPSAACPRRSTGGHVTCQSWLTGGMRAVG